MRRFTNLLWPEGPFGADQRPFGKPAPMIAALDLNRTEIGGNDYPQACASVVYLRVHRTRTLDVTAATLNAGYDVLITENADDRGLLVDAVDRAIVRARRHATVLAAHNLGTLLDVLDASAGGKRLPGVAGVRRAWEMWQHHATLERGVARLVDAAEQCISQHNPLLSSDEPLRAHIVVACLARALASALTAARVTGAYRWDGTFDAASIVERLAWDQLPAFDQVDCPPRPD